MLKCNGLMFNCLNGQMFKCLNNGGSQHKKIDSQSAFRIGQNGDFQTNMMTMMGIMMTGSGEEGKSKLCGDRRLGLESSP